MERIQSVVKRSCITITDVLSVSAYNTITTKPIAKKFCWKNKCHFLSKQKAEMEAIDMSILKIYLKMHSTSFFFFHI